MKTLLFISLFLSTLAYSQSSQNDFVTKELTAVEFETAKSLYLKMMDSDDYKEKEKINEELFPLLKNADFNTMAKNGGDFQEQVNDWIEKNIKTDDVDRVKLLFKNSIQLQEKIRTDNKEVFELLRKSSREQSKKIMEPFFKKARAKAGL